MIQLAKAEPTLEPRSYRSAPVHLLVAWRRIKGFVGVRDALFPQDDSLWGLGVAVMQVAETEIADVKLIKPVRHFDSRGFFSEVFKESVLREHGIDTHFVQDNHSLSTNK